MSRSYKKSPFFGWTGAPSEKESKRRANRKYRKQVKNKLHRQIEPLPLLRELSNVWAFDKDGKYYHKKATAKDMRK